MENLSEEFLLLWKETPPEQKHEEENREREEEQKKIRARWKPSELKLHMEITLLIKRKKMLELEELYAKKRAQKKAGEKAHNELMECYRKYAADCTSYLMFREGWIEMHPRLQFEDITTIWAMTYTNLPVPKYVYYCSSDSLQVYHAKIMVGTTPADLQWPLQVFGVVAARDNIDSMRNMIFNRDRDDCQTLTKELTYSVYRRAWFTGAHGSRLEISIEGLRSCVEATVFLRVIDGTWPAGFRGRFVASIPEVPGEVLLVAFGRDGESIRGDGNMTHLRHVVSVEQSGELIVSAQALDGPTVHRVVDRMQFKAKKAGRSFGSLGVGSCRVGVLVAWSRIRPRCNDGVPAELQQLCHD